MRGKYILVFKDVEFKEVGVLEHGILDSKLFIEIDILVCFRETMIMGTIWISVDDSILLGRHFFWQETMRLW